MARYGNLGRMKIVVCIKHVPDVQSERRLEGGRLVRGEDDVLNELDENAVEAAVALVEDLGGEVVALTMGPEDAEDGLRRALADTETAPAAARITLHHGDALELLPRLAAELHPDVVCLDPMYPARQKSAAVKKEMAYFHQLIGAAQPQNDAALLAAARAAAAKRVAVKRPRLGENLAGEAPAYCYEGKSTRFDIYLPAAKP